MVFKPRAAALPVLETCQVCHDKAVLSILAAGLKLAAELKVFSFLSLALLLLASETWHKLLPVPGTLFPCFLPG